MTKFRSRKVAAAWLSASASSVLFLAAAAQAQSTASGPSASSSHDDEAIALQKFVVTGSYIPTTETALNAGISPVVQIDRKVIEESGLTTTSELLQRITVSNAGSVPISNNATGFTPAASSISLRGMGPEATLVLINGRRVAPYPVGQSGTTAFVNLNTIPLSAVDSIEVLKDGASALYGADAVAGVVNIKMRRSADGTEASVVYGNTTNKDSSEFIASVVSGARTEKASALVSLNYYSRAPILHRDRTYSQIPPFLSSNSSPLNLQITREAALEAGAPASALPATGAVFFATSGATATNNGLLPASAYRYTTGRSSAYNFNESAWSYPRRDNVGMSAYADRKVFNTENIRVYVDASYQTAFTENQLAPSATGNFTGPGTELVIPARTTSPLVGADGRARAAPAGAYNPFNPFNIDITGGTRARLAEFGNRIFKNDTDAFLYTVGLKGDNIMENWNFDAGFSFSSVKDLSRSTLVSSSRVNRLLNAADPIFDPKSSEYIGTTIPYDPFGYYKNPIANNQKIVGYALITTKDQNTSELGQFNAVISNAQLVQLPAGPLGFALGGDMRHESLNQYPDPFASTGDLIGASPTAITRGQRWITGIFAEVKAPLLRDVPGATSLVLDLSGRHEQFLTSKRQVTVPKVGIRWQPIGNSLTFRASWSKGFREPSLYELYSTPTSALAPITNPVTGTREPEQTVSVAGNRRLAAERSKYTNLGIVWSPDKGGLKGLTLSVDYWHLIRQGTVDTSYQSTVDRYYGVAPGGLLPGESVTFFPNGEINAVNSVFFNVGETRAYGWDFSGEYRWQTDHFGTFTFAGSSALLSSFKKSSVANAPLEQLIGQDFTGNGEDGYLRWRHRFTAEWAFHGFTALLGTTYTGGFWDLDENGDPFKVKGTWIEDVQLSYSFHDLLAPWLSDTKVALGARNLFDKNPPFASGFAGNATGYPSFLYTSEGRFVYMSLSRKF